MTASSLAGPDFLAFVVDDLDAASTFWRDVAGLKLAPQSPPGAQVFLTRPVPFAVRVPRSGEVPGSGHGVAVWFSVTGDVDDYRAALVQRGATPGESRDGPFGRMFELVAPGGFVVTVHASAP